MTSMKFKDSIAGESSPPMTRLPVPESSSKEDTSISAFLQSTENSGASGVYSCANSHGLGCATTKLGHSQYSYAMGTPSSATPSGRSGFSSSSESRMDHASISAMALSMHEKIAFTEHDYIGLSETSHVFGEERVNSNGGAIPDLSYGETELRLGPPGVLHSQESHPGLEPSLDVEEERKQNIVYDEQISCRGEAPVPCTGEGTKKAVFLPCEKPYIPSDGPRIYPSSVAGAKRAFAQLCSQPAEKQDFPALHDTVLSSSAVDVESKHPRTRLMPPTYPWEMNRMPAMNLDKQRLPFETFLSTLSLPKQQNPNLSGDSLPIGLKDFNPKPWGTCPKTSDNSYALESASEARYDQSDSEEMLPGGDGENAHVASSPVVGWPPVQSFRNKALATQPQPKLSEKNTSSATPLGSPLPNSLLVKVHMDGVAIGRKVDMKTSNSYEKLSSVLEDMFRRFMSGKGRTHKLMTENVTYVKSSKEKASKHGSEYVLTYEDKDGDLMLVGDVPWSMFLGTVKRLRIMKSSDAIGLAPKALEKEKLKP